MNLLVEVNVMSEKAFSTQPGYKKTEIGIIPEDWEVKSLGEICTYIIDGTHKTPKYVKYGIPFYSVENVTSNDFKNVKYISEEEHKELIKRCKPEKGDILLTRIGDIGSTKLIDWDINASIYVSLAVLKIKEDYCKEYIYAYSKTKQWRKSLEDRSLIHATPKKINLGEIAGVEIPLPPLPEQRAIARILSDFDSLIESLDKLIEKKKNIKKGAMQELLTGKKRLPGFTGAWVRKRLGEIFDLYSTTSKNKYISRGGKYIIMDMGAVSKDGRIIPTKRTFIDKDLLKENDLVMPKDDIGEGLIIGKVAIIPESGKFVLGDHVYRLRMKNNNYHPKFFYYLINSSHINSQLKRKVTGSAQKGLSQKSVIEQEVYFPPTLEEQRAIAQILSDMDAEIEALEKKKKKYEMMKKAAMELLLTGKVRVKEKNGRIEVIK